MGSTRWWRILLNVAGAAPLKGEHPVTPLIGSCRRQQRAGVDTASVRLNLRLSLRSAENRQLDIVQNRLPPDKGFGVGRVYMPELQPVPVQVV